MPADRCFHSTLSCNSRYNSSMVSTFEQLCRLAGEENYALFVGTGYIRCIYAGLEFTSWLLNPEQLADLDEELTEQPES